MDVTFVFSAISVISFFFSFFLLKQMSSHMASRRSMVQILSKLLSRHLSFVTQLQQSSPLWCLVLSTLPVSSSHKKLLRGSFSCPVVLTFLICFCVLFVFPLYLPSKTNHLLAFYTQNATIKVYVLFLTIKSCLYLQHTCCQFKSPSFSHSYPLLCPLCCT